MRYVCKYLDAHVGSWGTIYWFPIYVSLFHFAYYSFLCFTQPSFFPLFHDHTQPFLWAPRLPVFWTLHLISWLSLHRLVLFLEFWSILSFGLYFFVSAHPLHLRGGALGIYQGRTTHIAVLWCCMSGRGQRVNNATCLDLSWLSVTSPTTHKQIGPFWCWFLGGWFVYILGPCGSLQ